MPECCTFDHPAKRVGRNGGQSRGGHFELLLRQPSRRRAHRVMCPSAAMTPNTNVTGEGLFLIRL